MDKIENYTEVVNNKESKKIKERIIDLVTNKENLSYKAIQNEIPVSDIFIYEVLKEADLLDKVQSKRKHVDLKHAIITYVLEHKYECDMADILQKFENTNHNQVIKYLEEEDAREFVPSKFGKIEHKVINFVKENPDEYSTQELIEHLNLNRKTFYKIYNSHPEIKEYFRTVSKNCKMIEQFLNKESNQNKYTYSELGSKLGISTIVAKNNVEALGYEDYIIINPSITQTVVDLINNSRSKKYTVKDIAEKLEVNYNTVYKIIQRHELKDRILD